MGIRRASQEDPEATVGDPKSSSRVTLNLHEGARRELEDLARITHLNMTDLVRLALIVFKVVYQNQKSGNSIKIFGRDGSQISEILLPV